MHANEIFRAEETREETREGTRDGSRTAASRADVFRTLYVNAENGMNLRLLHEALMRLDPAGDLPACAELVLGSGRVPDPDDGEEREDEGLEDEVLRLLRNVESRAEELGLLKIWRREETLALLGVAKRLVRLGVQEVVMGDIPLPPGHCRNDARWELLSRFSGRESERAGVGATAALVLDVLEVEQSRELCGRPVLASQIVGDEGTPFTLVLMELDLGDGMSAGDGAFEDGAGEACVRENGALERAPDRAGSVMVDPDEEDMDKDDMDEDGSCEDNLGDGVFETVVQFETNVDHITGEEVGAAIDALTADARVLDALWLSGLGKKNRPTGLLRVLCKPCHRQEVLRLVLRHTHTLGVREQEIRRFVARRLSGSDQLSDQSEVSAKYYKIEGRWYSRPESDGVVARAVKKGVGAPALRFAHLGIHK